MVEFSNFLNQARDAFAADAALRERHSAVGRYLQHRLREVYDSDAELRRRWPDFGSYAAAARKANSEAFMVAETARLRQQVGGAAART